MNNTLSNGGDSGSNNKKFLYTGPRKKNPFENEYESPKDHGNHNWSFNTNTHNNTHNFTASKDFDLEDIWSIKKNVNVPQKQGPTQIASAMDGWDLNVGKGFYSRHNGGNTTEIKTTASPATNTSGNTNWSRSYGYSYAAAGSATKKSGSPTTNKDFVKMGNTHNHQTANLTSGLNSGSNNFNGSAV